MLDIPPAVVLAAAAVAAATDLRCYRIPNALTIPLLFSGLGYGLTVSGGWGAAASLAGAVVGFAALFGLYLAGGMGAGDVKLMAGLGAWLGPTAISHVVLASAVVGGIYALGLWGWNRWWRGAGESSGRGRFRLRHPPDELSRLVRSPASRRELIPYGPVILAGLLISLARMHMQALM